MKNSSFFNLNKCVLSNQLWPDFINRMGIFKAKLAVRQALDLQKMQGNSFTLPVLILDTCGSALVNSQIIKTHIGLNYVDHGMLLIYSNKLKSIQLLRDNLD
tara:strand:- start:861 stop:1166 length:306 start_codon:yes stop_codon:yes gene_type:complete